ncbi:MAG: DUF4157 domain-containing protein [Coleofasciculus sp. G1-WW12-02]|uniref:eCIS core domain-containing protein n=1 Tax=Coleofasciculus sp. G1-WW12-02 TaxID=3068483 RepID=UPI0032F6B0EC
MGSQRRLNKKTSWEPTSLPVRNPLQTRPFGKGIQARRAELPTTNVLQTRPFGTPKQASSPKQEMPDLQAQLEQVKRSGYNAVNIPTLAPSSATPIQAKLTIGEPNDKYEQEADQVASQVVEQIHSPQAQQSAQGNSVQRQDSALEEEEEEVQMKPLAESIQRQENLEEEEELQAKPLSESIQRQENLEEEEELQTKPLSESIQRQENLEEEEELQTKPLAESIQRQENLEEEEELQMKPLVQRKSSGGGMAATPELEQSIASARGNGQPIADEVRQPMEQAFGADLSGVKIHTDSKADHLNRSVGARAFTTGQDVFFRQGEYNPGSKDGQELMAHEFTHVLQQTGGMVQREPGDEEAKPTKEEEDKKRFEEIKKVLDTIPTGKEALKLMDNYAAGVNFAAGGGSYYDSASNSMVIDSNEPPAKAALTFVHEMNHAKYHHQKLSADVSSLSREEYVKKMVEEEAEGTVKSIEAKIELEGTDIDVSKASFPLETEYREAFKAAVDSEKTKNIDVGEEKLKTVGREAGKKRVTQGFMNGEVVTSNTGESYPDYYGKYWDKVNPK